jgi:uncharacterized membrane protein YdjX (TVP38/TMEM64 family)
MIMYAHTLIDNKHIKKIGLILVSVFFIIIVLRYCKLTDYLTISYLHEHMHELRTLVSEHYILSVLGYMSIYTAAMACCMPGSSMFTIAGGVLFGFAGFFYAVIAATLGAVVLFFISRYCIGVFIQHRYAVQLKGFNDEIARHGHHYVLVVRLLALFPFCLVNLLSGLTLLSARTFACMTFIGIIPVSAVYVFAGNQLTLVTSSHEFSRQSAHIFSILILFKIALLPALVKITRRIMNLCAARKQFQS